MLAINALLRRRLGDSMGPLERVLAVVEDQVVLIEVNERSLSMPYFRGLSETICDLKAGDIEMVGADEDPCLEYQSFLEGQLSADQKAKRDSAYEMIAPLVEDEAKRVLLDLNERGKLIAARAEAVRRHKRVLYRHLQRFWVRGQTENALIPRFDKRGGKGIDRPARDGQPKRGRKSRLAKRNPKKRGVNVTETDVQRFRIALAWRYKQQDEGKGQVTLKRTWRWMCRELYTEIVIKNGGPVSRLVSNWKRPTFGQFKHWVSKLDDRVQSLKSRHRRRYNLKIREVLSSAILRAFGPGSIFEVDATVADVYLRSSIYLKRLVGRPVIYLVKDVFSQLIVGLHICLEGPNTRSIRRALENAFCDKVEFCRRFDIVIESSEWPCHHLCHELYGDRGELLSKAIDNLPRAFGGLRVGNAPPYRGDMKGIVERHFATCNEEIHWLPGAVRKRERGERDHRLDAKLDLHAFTRIIIMSILHYNKSQILTNYPVSEDMIQDDVPLRPLDLWNWGIVNRPGKLGVVARDVVRKHLLPVEKAVITERGIRCRGMFYTTKRAEDEGWFALARADGRKEVQVAVDELDTDVIYLLHAENPTAPLEPCRLLDRHPAYKGRDWYDVLDEMENQKVRVDELSDTTEQSEADLDTFVEAEIEAADQRMHGVDKGRSKAEIVSNIQENREAENEIHRSLAHGADRPQPGPASVPPSPANDTAGSDFSRFRQLRRGGRATDQNA